MSLFQLLFCDFLPSIPLSVISFLACFCSVISYQCGCCGACSNTMSSLSRIKAKTSNKKNEFTTKLSECCSQTNMFTCTSVAQWLHRQIKVFF